MEAFEIRLAQQVADFREWLAATYSPADIAALFIDDAGYPNWTAAEQLVAELLRAGVIRQLSPAAQADLLYLIARNWDVGSLLAWFSEEPVLSNVGPLTEVDFLRLAHTVAHLDRPEYDAAKYQFAACFRKLPGPAELTAEKQEILLTLFGSGHAYTQRQALHALAYLGYPRLAELLPPAWEASPDETHRMALLSLMCTYLPIPDLALLQPYLTLARSLPGQRLAELAWYLRMYQGYFEHCPTTRDLLASWRATDLRGLDPAVRRVAGWYLNAASGSYLLLNPNQTFVMSYFSDMGGLWRRQLAGRYRPEGPVLRLLLSARQWGYHDRYATWQLPHGPGGTAQWLVPLSEAAAHPDSRWERRPVPLLLRCTSLAFGSKSFANSLTVGELYTEMGPASKPGFVLILNENNRLRQYPAGIFRRPA